MLSCCCGGEVVEEGSEEMHLRFRLTAAAKKVQQLTIA